MEGKDFPGTRPGPASFAWQGHSLHRLLQVVLQLPLQRPGHRKRLEEILGELPFMV